MTIFDEIANIVKDILPVAGIAEHLPTILSLAAAARGDKLTPEAALDIQVELERLKNGGKL